MVGIQQQISEILITWGITDKLNTQLSSLIVLALILIGSLIVDFLCKNIVLGMFTQFAKRTKNQWDDLIVERKIIHKLIHIIPAILVYALLPVAFTEKDNTIHILLQKICLVYIIGVSLRFINTLLNLTLEIYNRKEAARNRPLKGFIQIIQVLVFFIGFILIISVLINKSPVTLFAGLGASAAILMLVFKDTILGFVAGIQLSANDMLRPGDWITMNKYGADGDVIEVTINAVKVRNFDKTITTIPPYALVSDSFQNWRGMIDSGGRRVKRSINIDMNSVRFCTSDMLEKFSKISYLTDYINKKEKELHQYNNTHGIDESILVNGRRQTNIGVFREYLVRYLKNHPQINKNMTCMVRHLQPTDKGIPVELYFFSNTTEWISYESIQADVFDHILAIIPEFGLSTFQSISGSDFRNIKSLNH